MGFYDEPETEKERGWQEVRDWHPGDQRLRAAGFKIHARPRRGEPLWTRAGRVWRQSEALLHLEVRARRKGGLG